MKLIILLVFLVSVSGYFLPQTAEEEGPFLEGNETYVGITQPSFVPPRENNQESNINITIENKTENKVLVSSGNNLFVNIFLILILKIMYFYI